MISVLVSLLLSAPTAAQTPPAGSQVTLPLSEYEALRKAQERASVTVVDTLRLSGSFAGRNLSIGFLGRSSGLLPPEPVLASAQGIVLYGCEGEGIVSRGKEGEFRLTPLAPRFDVRCRIATRGSDRLEVQSTPAVLWVESAVSDGEFVAGTEGGDGSRSFSVVRRTTAAAEGLRASATARYRITLRPDETRFRYEIQAHNPNRSRQGFDVVLAAGEHVQQVDASVAYDVKQRRYRFELPPGDSSLALSGSLEGDAFTPPVDAGLQYVLLESHPLLRPVVAGEVKRVSPQEVGMAAEFRGAQAFLLGGKQTLRWSVTRLEALRTTSFAVRSASHVFFLGADGTALGESGFAIDNQGSPDVSLPMTAEPTFASLQGDPVLLTKDAKGSLWLPIAQGSQQLVVQYRQPFPRVAGLARASLALPPLSVPATSAAIELRYPEEWFPLYEALLSEARIWTPPPGMVLGGLLLLLWTERVLQALGIDGRRRWLVSVAATLAALAWGWAAVVLILGDVLVSGVWLAGWMRRRQWKPAAVLLALAGALVLVAIALGIVVSVPMYQRSAPTYESDRFRAAPAAKAPESPRSDIVAEDKVAPAPLAEAYQGLPAKFQMPAGASRTYFRREMMATETPRSARVVMVSSTLLAWLQSLLVVVGLVAVWTVRREVIVGWAALGGDPAH